MVNICGEDVNFEFSFAENFEFLSGSGNFLARSSAQAFAIISVVFQCFLIDLLAWALFAVIGTILLKPGFN